LHSLLVLVAFLVMLTVVADAHGQDAEREAAAREGAELMADADRLRREGRVSEAIEAAEDAVTLGLDQLGGRHDLTAKWMRYLTKLYYLTGEYHRRVFVERSRGSEIAISLMDLGWVDIDRGDLERAEALFGLALSEIELVGDPQAAALVAPLSALADIQLKRGDPGAAARIYTRAATIAEHDRERGSSAYLRLAGLRREAGDLRGALAAQRRSNQGVNWLLHLLTRARAENEQRSALDLFRVSTDATLTLGTLARDDEATVREALSLVLHRKGWLLDAAMRRESWYKSHARGEAARHYDELVQVRSELAKLSLASTTRRDASAAARIPALEKRLGELENSLAAASESFRASQVPPSLDEVQRELPEAAALLEWFLFKPRNALNPFEGEAPPRYALFVLRRSGAPVMIDLGPAAVVDRAATALRGALSDPRRGDVDALARELDKLALAPARAVLGGERRLYLAPDGALNAVPFAALRDERGAILVERYTLSYLGSGRDLLTGKTPRIPQSAALVVAAPAFDAEVGGGRTGRALRIRFPPLPATKAEGEHVAARLQRPRLFLGAAATESNVKQARAPAVLHLATHAFFLQRRGSGGTKEGERALELDDAAQPLSAWGNMLARSGLAFAGANLGGTGSDDGILTALEASSLHLEGTDLVVLSACETGLGHVEAGEGVFGLRRALSLAGARSQVLSLWKVADQETATLMLAMYEELGRGAAPAEALRAAQRRLRANSSTRHPYFWAAFVVSGKDSPLAASVLASPRSTIGAPRASHGCVCTSAGEPQPATSGWLALFVLLPLGTSLRRHSRLHRDERLRLHVCRRDAGNFMQTRRGTSTNAPGGAVSAVARWSSPARAER
jgi:CHAT domain-containing protein